MTKLKFLSECSTEALQQVFDPAYSAELNCPLSQAVMREIAIELISRGVKLNTDEPIIHRAVVGPYKCQHGRSMMGTCAACDDESAITKALYKLAKGFRKEVEDAENEPVSTFGLAIQGAYMKSYKDAAEKVEKLMRAIIEGDDLSEPDEDEDPESPKTG